MEKNIFSNTWDSDGTKVAVAFANIILAKVETELLNKKSYRKRAL